MILDPILQPRGGGGAQLALQKIVGDKFHGRRQGMRPGRKFRHNSARPPQTRMFGQRDVDIGSIGQSARPGGDLAVEALKRGGAKGASMNAFGTRIGREVETVELADMLGAERKRARIVNGQRQGFFVAQMAHQKRGAPVDENAASAFRGAHRTACLRPRGLLPANGRDRASSPAMERHRSRCESVRGGQTAVSTSPSTMSSRAICRAIQSSGSTPSGLIKWR